MTHFGLKRLKNIKLQIKFLFVQHFVCPNKRSYKTFTVEFFDKVSVLFILHVKKPGIIEYIKRTPTFVPRFHLLRDVTAANS